MATLKTTYYADGTLFDAVIAALRGATESVELATVTDPTRAQRNGAVPSCPAA